MDAETRKAPDAPTPGTNAEAAPTAPNNSTAQKNEGSKTIMTLPTDSSNALDIFGPLNDYEIVFKRFCDRKAPDWVIEGDIAKHSLFNITIREKSKQISVILLNPAAEGDAVYTAREIQNGEYRGVNIDAVVNTQNLTPGERVLTLGFGLTAAAETCERDGCQDQGRSFREGNHNCEHELVPEITEQGIGLFYDLDEDRWAIDLEPAASDYFTGAKACKIASALVVVAGVCDALNDKEGRRPVENAAAPEFDGIV